MMGALIIVMGSTGTGHAAALAPKKPSQVLTVFHDSVVDPECGSFPSFNTQVGSDGNSAPFSIPPGEIFVVTEVEVTVFSGFGAPGTQGQIIAFTLRVRIGVRSLLPTIVVAEPLSEPRSHLYLLRVSSVGVWRRG
jgi:hypothetical protein